MAVYGELSVLYPMITEVSELEEIRKIVAEVETELSEANIEYTIPFIDNYAIYILLGYFLIINFVNVSQVSKFLGKTERYLDRTDITIASIFGNEVAPVFEFGNIVIFVYNESDEVIWVSQTTLVKKDDILGQKIYDLIPNFDDLAVLENEREIHTTLGGKTFQIEINTGLKVVYLKDVSAEVIQADKVEEERPFIGHVVIDNYQDVIVSLNETDFVLYTTEVSNGYSGVSSSDAFF